MRTREPRADAEARLHRLIGRAATDDRADAPPVWPGTATGMADRIDAGREDAPDPPAAWLRSAPVPPPSFGSFGRRGGPADVPPVPRGRLAEAVSGGIHGRGAEARRGSGGRPAGAPVAGRARFGGAMPLLDPGGPGVRVLVLLGMLAAAVALIFVWRSRPVAEPVAAPIGAVRGGGTPAPGAAPEFVRPSPTSSVVVHVTGKVRRPGVVALATGSRVADAIEAAGGVKKGASPGEVNLARRLVDGEQIVVGADAADGGGGPPSAAGGGGGVVNLNAATAEQLTGLPGVGEVLARRIVEFREAHGGFTSVEQLQEVSGIGERKFAELKDKVTV